MSTRPNSRNSSREIRRLRQEIARQRRRLDRRVDNLVDCTLLVGAARDFVRDHPARSILSAAGAGLLFGELVGLKRNTRRLGESLFQLAFEQAWPRLCKELRHLQDDWRGKDRKGDPKGKDGDPS